MQKCVLIIAFNRRRLILEALLPLLLFFLKLRCWQFSPTSRHAEAINSSPFDPAQWLLTALASTGLSSSPWLCLSEFLEIVSILARRKIHRIRWASSVPRLSWNILSKQTAVELLQSSTPTLGKTTRPGVCDQCASMSSHRNLERSKSRTASLPIPNSQMAEASPFSRRRRSWTRPLQTRHGPTQI